MGCSSMYRRGGEMVESRTSWLIWGPPSFSLLMPEAATYTQSHYLQLLLDTKPHHFWVVGNEGPQVRQGGETVK